jgi:hypothetical protein
VRFTASLFAICFPTSDTPLRAAALLSGPIREAASSTWRTKASSSSFDGSNP